MPERIQLRRARGWRLPPGAVSVARPSRWGNPFRIGGLVDEPGPWKGPAAPRRTGLPGTYRTRDITGAEYEYVVREVRDRADAVALFRAYIRFHDDEWSPEVIRRELGGRDLACWCPLDGQPCHADILLAISNGWEVSVHASPA